MQQKQIHELMMDKTEIATALINAIEDIARRRQMTTTPAFHATIADARDAIADVRELVAELVQFGRLLS